MNTFRFHHYLQSDQCTLYFPSTVIKAHLARCQINQTNVIVLLCLVLCFVCLFVFYFAFRLFIVVFGPLLIFLSTSTQNITKIQER